MSYEKADGFKIREQSAPHFLTFTVEGWIDIFTRQVYRDIILESMHYCRMHKGLSVGAYVVMSNHMHVIWTAKNNNLSDIVRDFKTYTSKAIIKAMNEVNESRRDWLDYMFKFFGNTSNKNDVYKVWTNNNHPEIITSGKFFLTKLNYIHQNPVRAQLVGRPEDYIYSSASNYIIGNGIFSVDLML